MELEAAAAGEGVGIAPTGFDEAAEERRVSLEPPTGPKLGPVNTDTQAKE